MHIVIVIPNISVVGGTTRVVATLANYWVTQKYHLSIITFVPYQNTYYPIDARVNIIVANLVERTNGIINCLWHNINRMVKLRKLIKQLAPSIVLAIGATVNILLAIALPYKRNYLLIASEHAYPPNKGLNTILKLLQKYSYKYLNTSVALTNKAQQWLRQHTNAKQVITIANPINYPLINHQPIISTKAIIQANKKTLLFVGELIERKGINLLIEVFANLSKRYSNWQLVIAGDGKLKQQLQYRIEQLNLVNKIYLLGGVGNLDAWYQLADLFVFPSFYEGLPCTLIEAMAYGLPCVSFDCPTGPSDIITHGVDGLLVDVGNLIELEQTLDKLMNDIKLRQQFATKAIVARERFSVENIANKWDDLFAKLIN